MKKLALLLLLITITFSCNQQTANKSSRQIPYTKADNYSVSNLYGNLDKITYPKITSKEEFYKIFGDAAVMGSNGTPTKIDFTTSYVIALIGAETTKSTNISVNSLVKEKNNIILSYSVNEGQQQTFTMRPKTILIVSKQYNGNIIFNKQ